MVQQFLFFIIFCSVCFSLPKLTVNRYGIIESDISYSSYQKNSLDLYVPDTENYPVILFIHGGSFVAGDRKDFPYAQIGESFQKRGIGCAVMSYRLLQDSVWPAQPRDVAKAVRWLKDNIVDFGGDPSKIFIIGHSAGGHLSALVCTDSTYLSEVGMNLSDIAGTVSLGAMMSDGGSIDHLDRGEQQDLFRNDWFFKIFGSREIFLNSFPIRHVNPSMPRMLVLLADGELYDPPKLKTVQEFIEASKKNKATVSCELLPDRTHMGTVEQMIRPDDIAIEKILRFILQTSQSSL